MASLILKLVFLFSFASSLAAPLRFRLRDAPSPAVEPVPLKLRAQQDSFDFDLATTLVSSNSTIETLQTVPASCAAYPSECTSGYQAVNVTYDDCGDAWTICRCNTANMTMDTAVERLGRVPVGLRRYVGTVLVSPDVETHAYTLTSGDIHVFGDAEVDTWVHEAAHAYDWASGTPFSGSAEWIEAIGNDTCVPDTYSATSAGEDFAQMTVMKVYSMIHSDSLPTGWSLDCMSHQMQYMSNLPLFNREDLFGGTCAIVPSDPFSKHAAAPSVTPTRVQPNYPAQPQTSSVIPVVNAAQDIPDGSSKKDNAVSSFDYLGLKLAVHFMGGSMIGWLLS
ncbi:hypothetical protein C0989_002572 [Termitomyces sp. Mn162]|nr:hypothetical protein C0989_002572 [Termitomyces sp. Mn162]KAH0585704.1 hypothetical protein H2248_008916 [Termitomyces sp. 'cryptogamus']